MVKVNCPVDCGNAPKKLVLRDFKIALVEGDAEDVLDKVRENIVWEIVGQRRIEGAEAMRHVIEELHEKQPSELHIYHIITHGWQAALHGRVLLQDGSQYAFCDIFEFAGASKTAKLKQITTYVTEID